ncbi:MAG: hypothetical protein V1859_00475 [archaeon]
MSLSQKKALIDGALSLGFNSESPMEREIKAELRFYQAALGLEILYDLPPKTSKKLKQMSEQLKGYQTRFSMAYTAMGALNNPKSQMMQQAAEALVSYYSHKYDNAVFP